MPLDLSLDLTAARLPLAPTETAAAGHLRGLLPGTVVLTLAGELPVEHLSPGDRIISRTGGAVTLRAVEVEERACAPIRILAGSLGHMRPERDLRLAPEAAVHLRDWRAAALFGTKVALAAAETLVDGEFVVRETEATLRVFTLVFDRPQIIYADGLEVGCAF